MRHPWSIAVLLALAVLAGYAATTRPVQAQAETFPFRVGDTVTFSFQGGGSRTCRIEEMKGWYARCGNPVAQQGIRFGEREREQWVNVAEVEWITRTPERQ